MLKAVDSTIVEAAIQYNDGYNESVLAFANCILTEEGGTHLTGFRSALTRVINDYAPQAQPSEGRPVQPPGRGRARGSNGGNKRKGH